MLTLIWVFIPAFHSNITGLKIIALIIGFVGVAYMALPELKKGNRNLILLGSGSAIFYSLEIVLSGYVSDTLKIAPYVSAFAKLFFQSLVMLSAAVIFKESLKTKRKLDVLLIILGGILLYISFILYLGGAVKVGPLERGALSYIDRIGAIVLGCWVFKEERGKLTKEVWIGGTLILGAGLLILI